MKDSVQPASRQKRPTSKAPKPAATPASGKAAGRQSTSEAVKRLVWIRSAGHCELCGRDLTQDPRMLSPKRWGEVAHVRPAGPGGPRATPGYSAVDAKAHTNEVDNLMLACPSCHVLIDADPELHSTDLLQRLHSAQLKRVALTAAMPNARQAIGLFFVGHHHKTRTNLSERQLLPAMLTEGLVPADFPQRIDLPEPKSSGRDAAYWTAIEDIVAVKVDAALRRAASARGDPPILVVAALADMPSLMALGRRLGDRMDRLLFSYTRDHGFEWVAPDEAPPVFSISPLPIGSGPIALVVSLSGIIPPEDVRSVLPAGRIVVLTVPEPNVGLVRNRQTISAFRDFLQKQLSVLEAESPEPIHMFPAMPASLAVEFGALLSMHHRHEYIVYDRGTDNRFDQALRLS